MYHVEACWNYFGFKNGIYLKEYIFAHIHHPTVKSTNKTEDTISNAILFLIHVLVSERPKTIHYVYIAELFSTSTLRVWSNQETPTRSVLGGPVQLVRLWFCYVVESFWSDVTCSFPFRSSRLLLSIRKHFVVVNHGVSSQMRHIECPCVDLVVKNEDLSLLNGNQCLMCHGNLSAWNAA